MSAQVQGTLLDVLKKKMRQTKEEMEKYKDECEEYQRRLQVEVMRREEVSEPKEQEGRKERASSFLAFFFLLRGVFPSRDSLDEAPTALLRSLP